jgi:two-component system, cell cycle sensor histidine kinase and response regulator CckA
MLFLVITSLLLHVFALGWAVVLLRRLRDWRLAFVIGALGLAALFELASLLSRSRLAAQPVSTEDILLRIGVLAVGVLVLLSVYAVGAMIGDRERFVQLARQNKERYRRLVESIGVIAWEADVATWRFTFVSGRAEATLGYPLERWYEQDFWVEHIHPEDRQWATAHCAESTRRGRDFDFQYRMIAADGRIVWLHDVVSITMRDGRPWRLHGAMLDITERKQAEHELLASELRYRKLFELNPQPMWVYDHSTLHILEVNEAAIRHYGYTREEFLAMTIRDIRPPEDLPRLEAVLAATGGRRKSGTWRHRKKDGTLIEVEISSDTVGYRGREAQLVVATDITERRRAEEERRRLETEREQLLSRLRLQFDRMPVGCILTDGQWRITDWNPGAERIFGWSRQEALGRQLVDLLVSEELRPQVSDLLSRLQPRADSVHNTNENITRDHRRITCEWQNTPIIDENGQVAGLLCTVQDVTARIASEEALRISEARLRRVFNSNVIGIAFWNADGAISEANDVFLHMLGYTREELQHTKIAWPELTPAEHAWLDARAREEMDATGVCAPFEKELIRKDGCRIPILMGAGMLDHDHTSGVAFVADITALKRARQLFRQSEERYRRLAEHGAMGIWEVTRDGRTVYANPAMCRMLEVENLDELRGVDYRRFFTLESIAVMEREQQRRLKGEQSTYEVELVGAHGSRRHVMISGAPVVSPGQELETFLGTCTDITGLKRAEEALRQSQKMDAVGQLASGVAHDFNNLITAIFGYTSLARRTLSPNHPATKALDRVDAAARQAAGVTRGLLTFSRESPSEKKPIQLGKAVMDAVHLLQRMLPPNVELRTRLDDSGSDWICGDHTQIQQVVMNLAINARDAMPQGGRLRITVSAPRPEHGLNGETAGHLCLSVSDTGHGMSPAVQARIFEPFFTTKPPGMGTGLGLPIIHGIVKDHGGTIHVKSALGQGSTFSVLLPRCESAPGEGAAGDLCRAVPGRGEVILLAEPQTYIREIIASMLQSLGYKVVQCSDAAVLSTTWRSLSEPPRLVIMDRTMCPPTTWRGGLENRGEIPAILMAPSFDGMESQDSSRTFLLQKPFQMSELASAVAKALGGAQEQSDDDDDTHADRTPR